ncbi:hypothetical protein M0804_001284 [Polistes exclamans]|nr:hypothetical protein M0804_001284 [Polistes exclamans]
MNVVTSVSRERDGEEEQEEEEEEEEEDKEEEEEEEEKVEALVYKSTESRFSRQESLKNEAFVNISEGQHEALEFAFLVFLNFQILSLFETEKNEAHSRNEVEGKCEEILGNTEVKKNTWVKYNKGLIKIDYVENSETVRENGRE